MPRASERGCRGSSIQVSIWPDAKASVVRLSIVTRSHWQASYLDGQTAIRHAVSVRLMRDGLEVVTGNSCARLWPYREIRQTQGFYSGEEVRLERGGERPEVLVVPDVEFLARLHEAAPQVGRRFHDP